MKQLNIKAVPRWVAFQNHWMPASVDTTCPFCDKFTNFPLAPKDFAIHLKTIGAIGRCPRCGKEANFYVVEPTASNQKLKSLKSLAIFPPSRKKREPIAGTEMLPDRIYRSYTATLDSYNASLWAPAVASCRRTLEGIAGDMLPAEERHGMLGKQLEKLPEHVDLSKPILELASTLRKGGNIGAHFDLEKEPDKNVTDTMIDLLEYFIEYIFLLTKKAETLEKRIDKLGKE